MEPSGSQSVTDVGTCNATGIGGFRENESMFAQMQGIEPMIEVFPLADLATAFEKMAHGKVRFRAVVRVTES